MRLLVFLQAHPRCELSLAELALELGCSARTVCRGLATLKEKRLLLWEPRFRDGGRVRPQISSVRHARPGAAPPMTSATAGWHNPMPPVAQLKDHLPGDPPSEALADLYRHEIPGQQQANDDHADQAVLHAREADPFGDADPDAWRAALPVAVQIESKQAPEEPADRPRYTDPELATLVAACEARWEGKEAAGFTTRIVRTDGATHTQALGALAALLQAKDVQSPGGFLRAMLRRDMAAELERWREAQAAAAAAAAAQARREALRAKRAAEEQQLRAQAARGRPAPPPPPAPGPGMPEDVRAKLAAMQLVPKPEAPPPAAKPAAAPQPPISDARRLRYLLDYLAAAKPEHRQRPAWEAEARALYERGVVPEVIGTVEP